MLCVKAEIISTQLLNEQDKNDILDGLISDENLFLAVKAWKEAGMPDYVGRKDEGQPQTQNQSQTQSPGTRVSKSFLDSDLNPPFIPYSKLPGAMDGSEKDSST